MGRERKVRLCWAVSDGVIRHISELGAIPARKRPLVTCPVCERKVTLKLGPKVTHHCAHRPHDDCAVTAGETALHLNCKLHIYRQLSSATDVKIYRRCTATHELRHYEKCEGMGVVSWQGGWDRVAVECKVGTLRPDITLFRGEAPVGAIEVFATHAVDESKEALLKSLNVPWLEVLAKESLYDGPNAWTADLVLPIIREGPAVPRTCGVHEAATRRAEHAKNNRIVPYRQRIADLYFPSGKRYRDIYTMFVQVKDGVAHEAWLERSSESDRYGVHRDPKRAGLQELLDRKFQELVEQYARRGIVLDSPMGWVEGTPPLSREQWFLHDPSFFCCRYAWHERDKEWFLPYAERERTWMDSVRDVLQKLEKHGSIPRPRRPRYEQRRRYVIS